MEFLIFLVGLLLGLIISWFVLSKKSKTLELFGNQQKEQNIQLRAELENLNRSKQLIETNLQQTIESQVFKAMQSNNQNFINLARQTMEKYFVEADKNLQNKTLEIEKIIQPLQKSLDQYDKKVVDFQNETSKGFGSIGAYLKQLATLNIQLTKQTQDLSTALKSPKVRGRWAEITLHRLVEYTGLNPYCDFSEQKTTETDSTRPDMIINLPNNRKIIVDSKLPLDAYLASFETTDEQKQDQLLLNHLKAVKNAINNLSSKKYSQKIAESIDFVVLYIAVEPALTAAVALDNNIINEALNNNVILATPTTFVALLQTIAYTWQQHQLSENAQNILRESQELYNRMITFTGHFNNIGSSIKSLNENYNKMVGSWKTRIEPQFSRITQLGIKNQKELPQIDEVGSDSSLFD